MTNMIMDPDMDGLETYRKILELHPGQKGIIASSFLKTERVKKTQSLGADGYIWRSTFGPDYKKLSVGNVII